MPKGYEKMRDAIKEDLIKKGMSREKAVMSGLPLNQIIHGDCLEVMKDIPDNSIDLVVTSPPYDNLRDYNNSLHWNMEIFSKIALEITRVLACGGCIVWIVNDATIKGSETGTSFKQALYFKEICGLLLHDTMIWNKGSAPFQQKNRYINCFDYMFVFSKGRPKTTNIIKDRKNKWACTQIHGTERLPNGQTRQKSDVQKSKKVKEFGSRLNIWEINPEKNNRTGHPAVFPEKIAIDHILTWSNHGDVVLDPFAGSGTTAIACINTGRNFIGIEIEEKYVKIARERIEKHKKLDKMRLFPISELEAGKLQYKGLYEPEDEADKEAKRIAAATWNKNHPKNPVTSKPHKKK